MTDLPLTEIKNLIDASHLLNQLEKNYWLKNLKQMTAPQLKKLVKILAQAKEVKWDESLTKLLAVLTSAAQKVALSTP